MEIFSKLAAMIFMKYLKINFTEFIVIENQNMYIQKIEETLLKYKN
jgi:hypothetical protein